MTDAMPYIAVAFSGIALLLTVGEKLFGGATALAAKFHQLEKYTMTEMSAVRRELDLRIDEYEKVGTVGFEAIRNNIHAMQMGLLEFRAKIAEDLHHYIRKDDYNAGISDVKRDVQAGFRSVDDRLGQLQDLIIHANSDKPGSGGGGSGAGGRGH